VSGVAVTTTLRWGVPGATSWIADKAVLPALASSPDHRVVAVGSRRIADAEVVAARFGADRAFDDYEEVISHPDVDAVYIPLPNSMHDRWVRRAADAGRHVLCEKPLATTAAEAAEMADACAAAGVVLMEAYMTPFHAATDFVTETLATGRLGTLRSARAEFGFPLADDDGYRWDPAMGGGALLDLGIYCLTPLLEAAGRPPLDVAASAVRTESGVDRHFSGWLDFGEGFTAGFSVSFDSPERQLLELVGSEAILTAEGAFAPGPGGVVVRIQHRQGQVEEMKLPSGDSYRGMVDHFAAVVRGDETLRRPVARSTEMLALLDLLRATAGASDQNERKGP